MSELRWTLLILGVVFIAALSWWERRRPRQAFAPRLRDQRHPARGEGPRAAAASSAPPAEPWIGESALSDVVLPDVALDDAPETREPGAEAGGRAGADTLPGPLEELPTLVIPDRAERLALAAAWSEMPPEPRLIDTQAGEPRELRDTEPASEHAITPPQASKPDAPEPEIAGAEGVGRVKVLESVLAGAVNGSVEPIVEWPADDSRRILALRLVAPPAERFPGRTLRLALAAEGFLLGRFSIFHKPDESNRAVVSAASLTRPGAFDLETMDSQRYAGLSLFAVLPGPKSPPQAFEELLATARNLNERLQGALQDERGSPLTALRVTSLRESVRVEAAIPAAAAANER
jgi:FtsZ-interacting cell division protein ZipA